MLSNSTTGSQNSAVLYFEGGQMKSVLLFLCFFTLTATIWLAVMEVVLSHPGAGLRIALDVLLACQSLCTILFLIFHARGRGQVLLTVGGGLIAALGISAVVSNLSATHFESYVLIIGLALVLQGVLTIVVLAPRKTHLTS